MFSKEKKSQEIQNAQQQLADIAGEFVKQNKNASRRRSFILFIIIAWIGVIGFLGLKESGLLGALIKQDSPFVAEVILSGQIAQGGQIDSDKASKLLEPFPGRFLPRILEPKSPATSENMSWPISFIFSIPPETNSGMLVNGFCPAAPVPVLPFGGVPCRVPGPSSLAIINCLLYTLFS